MAIDLILQAPNEATLTAFLKAHPPGNELMDADDNLAHAVNFCLWAGDGKFMTVKGTYDSEFVELTPPEFMTGIVGILRIQDSETAINGINVGDPDYVEPADPENVEQYEKNRVVRHVKDNGASGTLSGIPYEQLASVKVMSPVDVEAFLVTNDLPGHIWVGGNLY